MGTKQRSALLRRTRCRPLELRQRTMRVLGTAATASMLTMTPPATLSRKACEAGARDGASRSSMFTAIISSLLRTEPSQPSHGSQPAAPATAIKLDHHAFTYTPHRHPTHTRSHTHSHAPHLRQPRLVQRAVHQRVVVDQVRHHAGSQREQAAAKLLAAAGAGGRARDKLTAACVCRQAASRGARSSSSSQRLLSAMASLSSQGHSWACRNACCCCGLACAQR